MSRVGRVQRQVRRCLVAHNGPVPFAELLVWTYHDRRPWRWRVYLALKRYGVNVGRGLWAPNAELAETISPKKR